jgi:hypothetical protein
MATTQRRWDRMAMTPTTTVVEQVKAYLKSLDSSPWRRLKNSLPITSHQWRVEADFKVMQLLFEAQYHLPAHFDYVDYMKLVLQDVVISMANISTWHWVLLMAINLVWWVVLQVTDVGLPDDHICLFTPDCTSRGDDHRRQLGAAAEDACPCSNSTDPVGPDDIGATESLNWLWLFVLIGWFVTLMQALIVHILNNKMQQIIKNAGGENDQFLERLMLKLAQDVEMHADAHAVHMKKQNTTEAQEDAPDGKQLEQHPNPKHHVTLCESTRQLLEEADHILDFEFSGKNSNDVMSLQNYEQIMFWTKSMQLVIDFYLGFYVVHMRLRVRRAYGLEKAMDGDIVPQMLFHAAQIAPVVLTLYLLMLTARKIALLKGVLHKDEDAVSDVLRHMEQVRGVRQRIRDGLESIHSVAANPNTTEANAKLQNLQDGELALLSTLDKKYGAQSSARVDRNVIVSIVKENAASLSFPEADLSEFLSREAFKKLLNLDKSSRATALSAQTLLLGAEEGSDSIEVRELCKFLVGHCTDVVKNAESLQASEHEVQAIEQALRTLSVVDSGMLRHAKEVSRSKALFRAADMDGSNSVGRLELFFTLRRFKVPVTKAEFAAVFRVIDPDQSHSITMPEWLAFMGATNSGLGELNNSTPSGASSPRP